MGRAALPGATPRLELSPNPALVDEVVALRLVGAAPGRPVTLRARMADEAGQAWEAHAAFVADACGTVDVAAQAPLAGTYAGADPTGLFWSMSPAGGTEPALFAKRGVAPEPTIVTAEAGGQVVASATLARRFVAPDVVRIEVRDDGLIGTLFRPAGPDPTPGVLVLGGSDGGLNERPAALLASRGYAALALAYFGLPSLPPDLVEVPLEYFARALAWLGRQAAVAGERAAVLGTSRGGELALLLGATFPAVAAVVAYAPGAHVHVGLGKELTGPEAARSAWTHRGAPLPFAPRTVPPAFAERVRHDEPVELAPLYLAASRDPAAARAAIPVERIAGPVLLISGQDDRMWPAAAFAEQAMGRLAAHRHPYPDRHLSYPGAGHLIGFPYLPTTVHAGRHPHRGLRLLLGGSAEADARARADSWAQTLAFLARATARA